MLRKVRYWVCMLLAATLLTAGAAVGFPAWADDPELVLPAEGQEEIAPEPVFDVVPAYAHGDSPIITIAPGQLVQQTVFYAGETVNIDGKIEGTAFIAAQTVNITGEIDGDLFIAARDIRLSGEVTRNLYVAGQSIRLAGLVQGDVFGAGQSVYLDEGATLARDVFFAGELVSQLGPVGRAFYAGAAKLNLHSRIGQDVQVEVEQLTVDSGVTIGGDLRYTSPQEATIKPGAVIDGEVVWKKPEPPAERPLENPFLKGLKKFIFSLLGAFLFWLVIRAIWPRSWDTAAATLRRRPGASFGYGALLLLLTPLAVLILLVTVVGIPLAVISGMAYGSGLYLTQIVVAVLLGQLVAQRFGWPPLHWGLWYTAGALACLKLVGMIPLVGFLLSITVAMAGLGAIFLSLVNWGRPRPVAPGHYPGRGTYPGPGQAAATPPLAPLMPAATESPMHPGDPADSGHLPGGEDSLGNGAAPTDKTE